MLLVFGGYEVAEGSLDFTGGQLVAFGSDVAIGKEMAQGERAPARLGIFRVADTRHGAEIESGLLGDVLEYHGAQQCLVALFEVTVLPLDDGLHGDDEGVIAYLDSLDELLGSVDFLLGIKEGFLHLPAHVFAIVLVFAQGIGERLRDVQFGHVGIVELEGDGAVVVGIDDEVGGDLLQ